MASPGRENGIDERLKFLLTSTESLHDTVQEMSAEAARQREESRLQREQMQAQEERFQKLRIAMLAGIRAFLEGMGD